MGMASEDSNTAPIASSDLNAGPVAGSSVHILLRLEGLAAAALSAVFYARTGASWWLFAALWLTPDLSMLGYLAGPRLGARVYNAIHSYVTPATLAVVGLLLGSHALLPFALIWMNHIGIDRLMGYGLKYPAGFKFTHLSKLTGKRVEAIAATQNPA
jgi:Domain of unknown function (DUF4260)